VYEEGNMEQMIVCGMAMVALCWCAIVAPWRTVNAPVRFARAYRRVAYGNVSALTGSSNGTGR
jgi:hypothetical protein